MPSASFYIYASYISVVSKAGKLHRNIKLLYYKFSNVPTNLKKTTSNLTWMDLKDLKLWFLKVTCLPELKDVCFGEKGLNVTDCPREKNKIPISSCTCARIFTWK